MARYIDADKFAHDLAQSCVHKAIVLNVLDRQPTAEVAPKSEVAKIFENIEIILLGWCNSCYPLDVALQQIAELKKKYTEDNKYAN